MGKILCIIDGLESGGAQRQIVGLAGLLKEQGYDVELAYYVTTCFYTADIARYDIKLTKIETGPHKFSKFIKVAEFIRKGNFDVVIAYIMGPGVISVLAKKIFRLKYRLIVSERNVTPRIAFMHRIKFHLYTFADYVVSNSFSQDSIIKKHYRFLRKKSLTIQNFVDTNYFIPSTKGNDRQNYRQTRFIAVGRVVPVKNTLNLIRAAGILKQKKLEFQIDWFGKIDDKEYFMECKNAISQSGVSDRFKFHKPTSQILEEYQKCDALCLPSLSEGCPNVIAEAMSCGKPIICSDVCDNPQIVNDGINGYLFNPVSVENMAEALEKFIKADGKERESIGRRNRAKALESFSKDSFVTKYIKLFKS